jgi:hypothetical protein
MEAGGGETQPRITGAECDQHTVEHRDEKNCQQLGTRLRHIDIHDEKQQLRKRPTEEEAIHQTR